MLSRNKTRIVLVVEKMKGQYLASLAHLFGWSMSKTGAAALNIGMAKLSWSYDIVHKRWDRATANQKSEAIHWLEVAGLLPEAMFDKLEKEIDVDEERKKWREAGKIEERIRLSKEAGEQ